MPNTKYRKTRDTQRQKVYDFGWNIGKTFPELDVKLDTSEVQEFVDKAFSRYSTKSTPTVTFRADGRQSWYRAREHRIHVMERWGCTPLVLCHEVAHALMDKEWNCRYESDRGWYRHTCASHGPEFVIVFIELMKWYLRTLKVSQTDKQWNKCLKEYKVKAESTKEYLARLPIAKRHRAYIPSIVKLKLHQSTSV